MKKFDAQLARIEAMRDEPVSPALIAELRKAIGSKSGYLAGKAAAIASRHRLTELIPDLSSAFDRFMMDPIKADPQCWGKNGIVTTLAELGHDNAEIYLRGIAHIQLEPVWGGTEDTAGTLRSRSAHALVECRSLSDTDVLRHLLHLLIDAETGVRVAGVQSIARVNRAEAALLLRLKALAGDSEPEVRGACFSGILSVEGPSALPFVSPFLAGADPDVVAEAALALGLARLPDAVPLIVDRYRIEREAALASVLLTALAVSHQDTARDFLLTVIEGDGATRAAAAVEAVVSAGGLTDDARAKFAAAAKRNSDARVAAAAARL